MFDRLFKLSLLPVTALYSYQASLVANPAYRLYIPCVFSKVFDVECWGCGLSRAFGRLWRGDFSGAADFNMLVFPVTILLAGLFMHEFYKIGKSHISKGASRG